MPSNATPPRNLFLQNVSHRSVRDRLLIAPSVLSANFGMIGDECAAAIGAGADLLHLDVMDGHFVPNLTMGPDMVEGLRKHLPDAMLDAHLMVENPAQFVDAFARAGADNFTFHLEVVDRDDALRLRDRIHRLGMSAGLAINPPTPIEPHLDLFGEFDVALVMSVNPGFSGQAFIGAVLEKVRRLRSQYSNHILVQMDGGLGSDTLPEVIDAGCRVAVAGSAFFGQRRSLWADLCTSWHRLLPTNRAHSAR